MGDLAAGAVGVSGSRTGALIRLVVFLTGSSTGMTAVLSSVEP